MINVLLERRKNGGLVSLKAEGHAGYAVRGFDIVCSAVSVLIKTTLQVLEETSGINLESECPERGFVSFKVMNESLDSRLDERLVYAGEFLAAGLGTVQKEYPEYLKVKYTTV